MMKYTFNWKIKLNSLKNISNRRSISNCFNNKWNKFKAKLIINKSIKLKLMKLIKLKIKSTVKTLK